LIQIQASVQTEPTENAPKRSTEWIGWGIAYQNQIGTGATTGPSYVQGLCCLYVTPLAT